MTKFILSMLSLLLCTGGLCQSFDTTKYKVEVSFSDVANSYFSKNLKWLGGDGASSIDLENGKILWLFSDSFVCNDSSASRAKSTLIRNSIAIQSGCQLQSDSLNFHWASSRRKPKEFFHNSKKYWLWPGHGTMIRDKLLIFMMKVNSVPDGLGFQIFGWCAAIVTNPHHAPSQWKVQYVEGSNTFGVIAGSSAVHKDENFLYAFGCAEPSTHDVYLLRWNLNDAYAGAMKNASWWINGTWQERKTNSPVPEPLFTGSTEFSVHYDSLLRKYIQVQSFGFGEGKIGIRMADHLYGAWTTPYIIYEPRLTDVKKALMYAAKAHPEICSKGISVTYHVNSLDETELVRNKEIYYPRLINIKIVEKKS